MSKRNTRAAKARRRNDRQANRHHGADVEADHEGHLAGRDLNVCLWPGCDARWTVDIQRRDGWAAFLCARHAAQYVAEADEREIKSISGTMADGDLDVLDALGRFG